MCGQIIHDDHISFSNVGNQLLLDEGKKDIARCCGIDGHESMKSINAHGTDHCHCFPRCVRGISKDLLSFGAPTVEIGRAQAKPRLIQEYKSIGRQCWKLCYELFSTCLDTIRLSLFGKDRLFLCVHPNAVIAAHMDEIATVTPVAAS